MLPQPPQQPDPAQAPVRPVADLDAPDPAYAIWTPQQALAALASFSAESREMLAQLVLIRLAADELPGVAYPPDLDAAIAQPLRDADVAMTPGYDTDADRDYDTHFFDADWGPLPNGLTHVAVSVPLLGFIGALLSGHTYDGVEFYDAASGSVLATNPRMRLYPFYSNPHFDTPVDGDR